MSTSIDLLDEDDDNSCIFYCEIEEKIQEKIPINLPDVIMDLQIELCDRISALNLYSTMNDNTVVELLSRINGMYQMSGIKTVEIYLYEICTASKLSSILKLSAVKALIEYEELIDEDDSEEDIDRIKQSNIYRCDRACMALESVCSEMDELPTPCRVEAIELLMSYNSSKTKANEYFISLINDTQVECEFRYKTILGIEKFSEKFMKDKLLTLFNSNFVAKIYELYDHKIKSEFPGFKPGVDNYNFFEVIIQGLSYNMCSELYKEYFIEKCMYNYFIYRAQYAFLFYPGNMVYYKVLAAQYLLQKCDINEMENVMIENEVLSFAQDPQLDYNRRADAADVLLQLGSVHMRMMARNIITELGVEDNNKIETIFSNAQNVHTTEVEESVSEILEFLAIFPMYMVQKKPIEFNQVQSMIKDGLRRERPEDVLDATPRENKIILALNRIDMDRVLYSKYNNTLSNVLLKVWSYIMDHSCKEEMYKRLLEELEEMSGTCSTGFVSRMVNVVSGFGEFNVRISWGDQITANFSGRLNASARIIMEPQSIFRTTQLESVIDLWLKLPEQRIERIMMMNKLRNNNPKIQIGVKDIVNEYLKENTDKKIDDALEYFSLTVLEEMSVSTLDTDNRRNFGLFFRASVGIIREEMYEEFKEHLDDASFDMYMRKALMHYEGVM